MTKPKAKVKPVVVPLEVGPIEENVPIPSRRYTQRPSKSQEVRNALRAMNPGQCRLFKGLTIGLVRSLVKTLGFKIATRQIDEGIKIWRI